MAGGGFGLRAGSGRGALCGRRGEVERSVIELDEEARGDGKSQVFEERRAGGFGISFRLGLEGAAGGGRLAEQLCGKLGAVDAGLRADCPQDAGDAFGQQRGVRINRRGADG